MKLHSRNYLSKIIKSTKSTRHFDTLQQLILQDYRKAHNYFKTFLSYEFSNYKGGIVKATNVPYNVYEVFNKVTAKYLKETVMDFMVKSITLAVQKQTLAVKLGTN